MLTVRATEQRIGKGIIRRLVRKKHQYGYLLCNENINQDSGIGEQRR